MPRLRRFDNFGTARAINFSCYHRYRLLADESAIRIFLDECDAMRKQFGIAIAGYVVMPSHVHLVLVPQGQTVLGKAIGALKSRSARRILAQWRTVRAPDLGRLLTRRGGRERFVFWQSRFYDHNCRTLDGVREMIQYCHVNPVRAGLVADAADWPWSSYRWYHGLPGIVLEVDGAAL
jgi:putative transposase